MSYNLILLYHIVQILILILLGLSTFYILLFSSAGLFYKQAPYPAVTKLRKIAVLIPGYKEDEVIIDVAHDALLQDYPADLFDVVIIADSFKQETIRALSQLPIKVIEVKFDKSTKSKALNKAMAQLPADYEIAVVLDADNLMGVDFLSKINASFEHNYMAVQGHRAAKNMNTPLAILDAVSEEINNHIFRKGHRALGLSSAIIGSGMAFRYDFFKNIMSSVTAVGGFDKEIELRILKDKYKIDYLSDAFVYDEKVQKAEVFSNQRRRWLSAQLHYFRQDFLEASKGLLLKGNVDYFDKALQFIQPPRILLLASVIIFGSAFLTGNYFLDNSPVFLVTWGTIISTCLLAFLFSIPFSFYNLKTLHALLSLPKGMLLMLLSLLKIKGANKKFIHTKHTSTKNQI